MKNLTLLIIIFLAINVSAQDKPDFVYQTFRGTRIVNGHSVEMQNEGELDFIIGHRFGRINGGAYEFFGLDQATMRLGFDYGIKKWVNIGIGRSTVGKMLDGYMKFRILRQAKGDWFRPISITAVSSFAINTLKPVDDLHPIPMYSRFSYSTQLLMARKFGDRFSVQLMPTYVHYNLVKTRADHNDVFSAGIGSKYQITKNLGITAEYYFNIPPFFPDETKKNSLSFGLDINTGGHVFQIHFSNSAGMIEQAFIGNTTGNWLDGDIHLGFNMVRTFKLKGRRY